MASDSESETSNKKPLKKKKSNRQKHTLNFLCVCTSQKVLKCVLSWASNSVIKSICNAAYNLERGPIELPNKIKALFAKHRKQISILSNKSLSISQKRKFLLSGGLLPLVPVLLKTITSSIGDSFIIGKHER